MDVGLCLEEGEDGGVGGGGGHIEDEGPEAVWKRGNGPIHIVWGGEVGEGGEVDNALSFSFTCIITYWGEREREVEGAGEDGGGGIDGAQINSAADERGKKKDKGNGKTGDVTVKREKRTMGRKKGRGFFFLS